MFRYKLDFELFGYSPEDYIKMGKPGPEDIVEDPAVKEVRKPESDNRENIVDPNNENVVNDNVVNDNVVNPDKEIEPQNVVSEIEAQESEENQDTPIRNST